MPWPKAVYSMTMYRLDSLPSLVFQEAVSRGELLTEVEAKAIADEIRDRPGEPLAKIVAWFDARPTVRTTRSPEAALR